MRPLLTSLVSLVLPAIASAESSLGTERSALIEFTYTQYVPQIDDAFGGCNSSDTPYERVFGDEAQGILRLGYEGLISEKFGTLSAGASIGYFATDDVPKTTSSECFTGSSDVGNSRPSIPGDETTALVLLPVETQLSYRLTEYEDRIPLVPVLRVGLDYYHFRIYDGDEVARFGPAGDEASGGTFGYHWAAGLHLLLDFLSPEMAADFDRDAGVNGSYLTFEYLDARIDDFGSEDSLRLGDQTWRVGLLLDF